MSRNAAEEVYAATKERVDGIGGVQAWRKREMEMRQAWQWEYEEGKNTRRDEDTAPEERADKGASRDMRAEKDDGGDLDTRDESEEDEVSCLHMTPPVWTLS